MTLQKSMFRFYIKGIAVMVYCIFFAVHIFFNFASGKNIVSTLASYRSACVSKTQQVTQNPKTSSHQLGFRLNKHFQPKSLPSGIFSMPSLPVCFIGKENSRPYEVDFIASPFYSSSRLRGPPQMNNIS
jgi:hypothetical protein